MMTDENDIVIEPIVADESPTPTKPMAPISEPVSVVAERTAVSPSPSPATAPPPPPPAAVSQRRGCVLLILGALLGAILGTVLTLSILMGLNGSLSFASTDAQLRRAINEASIEQENTANILATRSAHMDEMATQVSGVVLELEAAQKVVGTVEANVGEVQMAVTAVATQVHQLDNRLETAEGQIETVAAAAEKFDTFLAGLKALLLDEATPLPIPGVQEGTVIWLTPTTTATAKATVSAATSEPTATGEAARTVRPTRTPLPTSTPLPLPTSTPAPRP